MSTYVDDADPRICILPSDIQTIIADECPKVSTTEVGLPIAQTIIFMVASFFLHGSSEALQILTASVITALILLAVWIKRRHMIVVRIEEKDYYKIRSSRPVPHIFNLRERTDFFGCFTPTMHRKDNSESESIMDSYADMTVKPLHGYAKACVTASWLIMAAGRIKLRQKMRADVSTARALADEWEYELEQEVDPLDQAYDATSMLADAVRFALRYGFIGRAIRSTRQYLNISNNRCECGKLEHECGKLHTDPETGIAKKKF